ncbi:DMT family transporter [Desulfovibrio sp. UCD-KL4C]|uniref:DMT family transporter n=1 Tax=Desulfovibrio sp. UCD-KL4C TaxID=2578120 RepID=UPI0025BDF7A2|nr:DMT family transporter [Desulfovibrio sp. UCD-KL4C]
MSPSRIIYFKLIGSVVFWGGTWIAGKILAGDMSPYSAAFLRFLSATFFMFILVCRSTGKPPKCSKVEILPLMFLAVSGVFLYNIMFFKGLQTISAGRASLIIAAMPTVIAIGSAIIFKEKFTLSKVIGFLLALAGVCTVIGNGNPFTLLTQGVSFGDLCIIGCVLSWTAYSLAGKPVMKKTSPLNAVFWSCLFGTGMLAIPAFSNNLIAEVKVMSLLDLGSILYLSFLGTTLAFSWYCDAIGKIGPSKTGIFINLVPITAILLGVIFLGESVGMPLIIGGILTISGVWLTNRS